MTSKTVFGLALILIPLWEAPGRALPLRLTGLATASGDRSAEARVEVYPAFRLGVGGKRSEPLASVRARADGFFSLAVPEAGVYRVVIRADGFLPLEIVPLPVVEAADLPPAELEPALPLEIRVNGPDGRPAAWVAVCAAAWDVSRSPGLWTPAERCGTTAEDGRVVLSRGREERPVLAVADPRFAAGVFEVGEASEETPVTLRLAAARVVALAVRGPDGKPATGVAARIGGDAPGVPGDFNLSGTAGLSDPAGRLDVAVPAAGTEVELAGEGGLWGRAVFFPGEAEPRTVVLAPPRRVTGRVLDAASRRPLAGALVWTEAAAVRTGTDGTFRLAAGRRRDLAIAAVAAEHGRRTLILPQEDGSVTLALPPAGALVESGNLERRRRLPAAATARVLTGRVVGPEGRPVAGAWVEAARSQEAETDGDGRFRLAGLPSGATVSLLARAPGRRGALTTATAGPVEIRLTAAATLEGRVTDAGGHPTAGVPVLLGPRRGGPGEESPAADLVATGSARTLTDDDGRYRLDSLEPVRSFAAALRPGGRRLAGAAVDLRAGENRLDLIQPPEIAITGRVLDEKGAPVAAARIFLEGAEPEDRWLVIATADGAFRLAGIPDGDYRLSVFAKGLAQPEPQDVRVAGAPAQGIELRLGRGVTITGKLTGIEPAELNGLMILAEDARSPRSRRLGLAAPDGRYRIPDLPLGHWKVTGRTAAGRQALASVDVAPGSGETALDLSFVSGLTLSGRLRVDGQPAAGTILATAVDGAGNWQGGNGGEAPAAADGVFCLAGLQPGSYLLLVVLDGKLWPLRTVELTADRELPLDIVTGTLSGRIVGPYGSPLPGARVSLRPRTLGIDAFLPGPRAESDGEGAFEILHIPAGSHHLLVTRDGATPFETAVTLAAGGAVRVEVPLAPGM
ncbi:MAG TPA: carboxypeptidase regulatory-like domain-containing protein [Thermoanaerobaculia bacterium]|jgi:protocatechuate 3,4-dioxygenase beta subunit|nr:carboxypeptidase regulatory-like domain-containing protein [Thermoanaerobaculia bacterium]